MLTASSSPALYLDYGADAQVCATGDLDISERGMRFVSRWQFSIGTQISVLLVQMDPQRGLCLGCARTLDEIARWGDMTDREREQVIGAR